MGFTKTQVALASGGIAGCSESLATMPFEVTKNRLQMGHGPRTMAANMVDTVRSAGPLGLYYGLQAQIAQVTGKTAIRFAAYERFTAMLPPGSAFTAGTLAGLVEAIVWVAPTERLKMLRQAEISATAASTSTPGTASVLRAARTVEKWPHPSFERILYRPSPNGSPIVTGW